MCFRVKVIFLSAPPNTRISSWPQPLSRIWSQQILLLEVRSDHPNTGVHLQPRTRINGDSISTPKYIFMDRCWRRGRTLSHGRNFSRIPSPWNINMTNIFRRRLVSIRFIHNQVCHFQFRSIPKLTQQTVWHYLIYTRLNASVNTNLKNHIGTQNATAVEQTEVSILFCGISVQIRNRKSIKICKEYTFEHGHVMCT